MKIGIDARQLTYDRPAGIAHYVSVIIDYLAAHDHINEYYLYSHKKIDENKNYGRNFHFRVIEARQGTFWLRYQLPKNLKQDAIDVFWGPEHVLPKKTKDIKYLLTIHDLALLKNPQWGKWYNTLIQNLFVKKSVKEADKIIAISNATRRDIINICHIQGDKVSVIYNGGVDRHISNTKNDSRILSKFKIRTDYFLFVGTLEPRKNIITIVKAFEKFCERNTDCQLVLAGGIGWNIHNTIEYIHHSKYKDRILLTGYISEEEKDVLYRQAAAFIFPSHYEGFGIPVLEAMSSECLVITDRISSLPEVGGNAAIYVCNHKDPIELADVMQTVLDFDETTKKQYIDLGLRQAEIFSWKKCGEDTMKCILGEMT